MASFSPTRRGLRVSSYDPPGEVSNFVHTYSKSWAMQDRNGVDEMSGSNCLVGEAATTRVQQPITCHFDGHT
jgi:hypothetical protein